VIRFAQARQAILEPAALLGRAAVEKCIPVAIDFGLIVTVLSPAIGE